MCLPNVTQRFLMVISFLICQASRTVSEGWVGVRVWGGVQNVGVGYSGV